jgi:ABC-type uncharacterized transport system substrate-binding protein
VSGYTLRSLVRRSAKLHAEVTVDHAKRIFSRAFYDDVFVEFVRRKVNVIVTSATAPTVAAKQATSAIPIVFASMGDRSAPVWSNPSRDRAAMPLACRCRQPTLQAT